MDFTEDSENELFSSTIVKEEYSIQKDNTTELLEQTGETPSLEQFDIIEITPTAPDGIKEKKRKKHKCLICGKSFSKRSELDKHVMIHSKKINFHCAHCPKAYGNKDTLRVHIKTHFEKNTSANCPVCQKTFLHEKSMKSHYRRHKKTPEHRCEYCGRNFLYRSDMNRHIGRWHEKSKKPPEPEPKKGKNGEKKPLACPQCGLYFWGQFAFDRHVKTHENIQAIECSICSKQFTLIKNLNGHMLLHNRRDAIECEICGRKFMYRKTWARHKETHKTIEKTTKVAKKRKKSDLCVQSSETP